MKKLALALVALSTVTGFSSQAFAESPRVSHFEAKLEKLNIDPRLTEARDADRGVVRIDMLDRSVQLVLTERLPCTSDGSLCLTVMPRQFQVSLPILSDTRDQCGSRVVVAGYDQRPVDGGMSQLVVKDNNGNHCPHFVALPATEVVYETSYYDRRGGGEVATYSTFEGESLQTHYSRPKFRHFSE